MSILEELQGLAGNYTNVDEMLSKLRMIKPMCTAIRVVDPLRKRVLNIADGCITETELVCHDFWQRNQTCDNCISMRALAEQDIFIKLEYTVQEIFLIVAIPMHIDSKQYVMEILKDVTQSMFIANTGKNVNDNLIKMINELHSAVIKDSLTGIYNKRFVSERLPAEIRAHNVAQKPLAVLMADIDFFKNVNDTFGHVAGDYVLQEVAQTLQCSIRENQDWVSRYGGEEFLICLTNADQEVACKVAEKMRAAIENLVIQYENDRIKVTISFGICVVAAKGKSKLQAGTVEEVIACADHNLYEAKRTGRNKVVV